MVLEAADVLPFGLVSRRVGPMSEALAHGRTPCCLVTEAEDAQRNPRRGTRETPVEVFQVLPSGVLRWSARPANLALTDHLVGGLAPSVVDHLEWHLKRRHISRQRADRVFGPEVSRLEL